MKKVLHLITGLEFGGGAENALLQIIPKLKKTKNVVCCLLGKGEIGKKLEQKGIKVYYLSMENIFDFSIIFKYKKILKKFKPDIQVNYLIHADFFGRIFGKLFGVKKMVSFNRLRYTKLTHTILDKISFVFVNYLITNSESNKSYYAKKYNLNKGKIFCIPNGIDLIKFEFITNNTIKKEDLNLRDKDFVLCCVARLDKQKDHRTLFRAIKKTKIPALKLILCGDGKEKSSLMNLRAQLGLADTVLFLGNRKDILDILRITDIFVLPSLYEGMSNALLEAMASKCCCIVSDIEENKELIENGINGASFKAGDAVELSEKIKFLKKNKHSRKKYGIAAYKKIKEAYNINKIIKEYDSLLEKI